MNRVCAVEGHATAGAVRGSGCISNPDNPAQSPTARKAATATAATSAGDNALSAALPVLTTAPSGTYREVCSVKEQEGLAYAAGRIVGGPLARAAATTPASTVCAPKRRRTCKSLPGHARAPGSPS